LLRRLKKNLVAGFLIAVSIAVFFLGSAVIAKSAGGIRSVFEERCTGDYSISVRSETSFSVFGSDIPTIGDYDSPPLVRQGDTINSILQSQPEIKSYAFLRTAPCRVELGTYSGSAIAFGVFSNEYFQTFPDIHFVAGGIPDDKKPWIILTAERVKEMQANLSRPLVIGEQLQLATGHSDTFTIRTVTLAGIISYEPSNQALSHVVIADARTIGDILEIEAVDTPPETAGVATPETIKPTPPPDDIDSMFASAAPLVSTPDPHAPTLEDFEKNMRKKVVGAGWKPAVHSEAWHFVLVRLQKDASRKAAVSALESIASKTEQALVVRDWQGTAGLAASYVIAMQMIFYTGFGIIILIVVLVTVNSIVVSVMERTGEIGTMRAIGASRSFISAMFIFETMVISILSGLVGTGLGFGISKLLNHFGIPLNNELLTMVFGAPILRLDAGWTQVFASMGVAFAVGMVAWIYPVSMALRIQPIQAIQKA